MLAAISTGHITLADVMFLVALILFGIATVLALLARTLEAALIPAGLTCLAIGWLVL
jgi:hypothetical protein